MADVVLSDGAVFARTTISAEDPPAVAARESAAPREAPVEGDICSVRTELIMEAADSVVLGAKTSVGLSSYTPSPIAGPGLIPDR